MEDLDQYFWAINTFVPKEGCTGHDVHGHQCQILEAQ